MIEFTNPYFRKPKTEFFDWQSLTPAQLDDEIAYLNRLADKYKKNISTSSTSFVVPGVICDALRAAHSARRKLKAA